jgi:hypothetical protein
MAHRTEKLEALRPVTFHLRSDPNGPVQYGLVAEEVAKVYPELVIRGEDGRVDGVRYDELAPMMLNEMKLQSQKQQGENLKLAEQNRQLVAQVHELQAAVRALQASSHN